MRAILTPACVEAAYKGQRVETISFWPHVGVSIIAIALIAVGFTLRARPRGIFLLWLGVAAMLGLVLHTILAAVAP